MLLDLRRDETRLALCVHRLIITNRRALRVRSPERLLLALRVVLDDGVGDVEDSLSGAVVLFELDYFGRREVLLEVQDVRNVCPAPAVHTLTLVADHADVLLLLGEEVYEGELEGVGVLVFVDEDVAEALVVVVANVVAL